MHLEAQDLQDVVCQKYEYRFQFLQVMKD